MQGDLLEWDKPWIMTSVLARVMGFNQNPIVPSCEEMEFMSDCWGSWLSLLRCHHQFILDIVSLWDFSYCLWTQDKTHELITLVLITSLTVTMEHLALFVGWKSISVALTASRHWVSSLLRGNTSTHLIFRTTTLHSDMHLCCVVSLSGYDSLIQLVFV